MNFMSICWPLMCERWSIVASLFMYTTFLGLVWSLALPLRSESQSTVTNENAVPLANQIPDHLEGVRLERDGDINRDFHKEVFLGEGEFQKREKDDPKELLQDIFVRADINSDSFLSKTELTKWIDAKIQQHINQALAENYILFGSVDIHPKNGLVSWDEYHQYFLKQKGFSKQYAENHDKHHNGLDRNIKETIMRDKAAWSEASHVNPDHLTADEFLAFRHPESSHATILTLVEELFDKFDRDGDEILTEEEFSNLKTDDDEDKTIHQGEDERRLEFRSEIDKDKDGKADRKELLMYIDPKNPRHAREEAETLIALADTNLDGRLSLTEVLNKMDLFLGSKMVDTAKSFHDEF